MIYLNIVLKIIMMSFSMLFEIFWALVLGFFISAIIQALVSKNKIANLLPDDSVKSLAIAAGLGAASSSCSYAATSIARSLFKKGANFTSAIAFQFASTNLVIEMGIVLWILLGWQFALAEYVGGIIMIIIIGLIFRLFLQNKLIDEAAKNLGEDDVMIHEEKTNAHIIQKIFSKKGFILVSQYFIMDVSMLKKDIAIGLLIAGAMAVLVPSPFWQSFFMHGGRLWGPIIGPFVAILAFVCSIGNVPLAAVLWAGGISFGGVISFLFADLLIIPILNIYRKYYGMTMAIFLAVSSYIAMVLAGFLTDSLFTKLNLVPEMRKELMLTSMSRGYTMYLNILFLLLLAYLIYINVRTPKTAEAPKCPHCK